MARRQPIRARRAASPPLVRTSDGAPGQGRARLALAPIATEPALPRGWAAVALAQLLAVALVGLLVRPWPGPATGLAVATAIALVLSVLAVVKGDSPRWRRLGAGRGSALTMLGLPTALLAMLLVELAAHGSLGWGVVGAGLVIIALFGVLAARGVPGQQLAVLAAIGSAPVVLIGDIAGDLLLGLGLAVVALTQARQRQQALGQAAQAAGMAAAAARAQAILTDFEATGHGWFWETDRRGLITYLSPPIADLLGWSAGSTVGRPLADLFNLSDVAGESERTLSFHLSSRSAFTEVAMRAAVAGEERWWSLSGQPIYDKFNNFHGFRGSGHDLTEKRRSAETASRLAQFDSLTGLSNRLRMAQTLERILGGPEAHKRACAVLLLDLDRFKAVNDTLGHPAGDILLQQVAQRLERVIGLEGRVGRLGGDEFEVILPGMTERERLALLAQQVIETLSAPYTIDHSRVLIGASVGIALAPDDGVTSEALIRNADLALYAAKDNGRGCYHFYAPDLHSDAEERRTLEGELRDAIAAGALELVYQPVVETVTERVIGFEALVRWQHPRLGPIPPSRFIPVAEESGLIVGLGEWALATAVRDCATWPAGAGVAVNVSALQFANPALPDVVAQALAAARLDPHRLELEITESVFLRDGEGTDRMFRQLKDLGVRMALDDFGTGYSSLGYLRSAPFDTIKIDQSFVRGATEDGSRNGAIIAAIVSLADALGMATTAEGVETLDELDLVRQLGCTQVQGFIYERALTALEAGQRLTSGQLAVARGPRSARAVRQATLRKVVLEHGGHQYHGVVRNLSRTGAQIEGLWNVPAGTVFRIQLADRLAVSGTCRWSADDRIGIEFAQPLAVEPDGRITATTLPPPVAVAAPVARKVG